jgi:hypothetical protein
MEWSEVEPVLAATYRLLADQDHLRGEAVIAEMGRPPGDETTGRALENLHRTGYIEAQFVMQRSVPVLVESTEKGLQHASGWPRDGGTAQQVELLLGLLDERIASDATPEEEKGRLRRARDAVASVGKDVFADVLAAYLARQTGLGD